MTKKHNAGDTKLHDFAVRFNRVLDLAKVPQKNKGRQVSVAQNLFLSPGGARKLLEGESEPSAQTQRAILQWLKTQGVHLNLNWLLTGEGEMTMERVAVHTQIDSALLEGVMRETINELRGSGVKADDLKIAKLVALVYDRSAVGADNGTPEVNRQYLRQVIKLLT